MWKCNLHQHTYNLRDRKMFLLRVYIQMLKRTHTQYIHCPSKQKQQELMNVLRTHVHIVFKRLWLYMYKLLLQDNEKALEKKKERKKLTRIKTFWHLLEESHSEKQSSSITTVKSFLNSDKGWMEFETLWGPLLFWNSSLSQWHS